jgi:uncharacterized repeat protein (TIGR02543 family)
LTAALCADAPAECAVTFDADGGTVNPASVRVNSGDRISALPETAKQGGAFNGWFTQKNGGGTAFTETTAVTADITVYAKWTETAPGLDGGKKAKTALPFPEPTVTDVNNPRTATKTWTKGQYNNFSAYILNNHVRIGNASAQEYGQLIAQLVIGWPVSETITEYKKLEDVALYRYCEWREPNNILTITLSDINEKSVSNSITTSLEVSAGLNLGSIGNLGIMASISEKTSITVSFQKGKKVSSEYDLTKYEQDKRYQVILTGAYTLRKHTFTYTEGGVAKTVAGGESINVDHDNMAVILVHN